MSQFNLAIVGDNNVGKTILCKRLYTGEFYKKYIPTLGIQVSELKFNSNYGPITFQLKEVPGNNEIFSENFTKPDGIIGICDITSEISADNLNSLFDKLNFDNIPSVACGIRGLKKN